MQQRLAEQYPRVGRACCSPAGPMQLKLTTEHGTDAFLPEDTGDLARRLPFRQALKAQHTIDPG